jgi:transposase
MTVELHLSAAELSELIEKEKKAKRRQRLRMIRWALDALTAEEIAIRVKSSRRRVQDWVARWNRDGLLGLEDQPGRGGKLPLDAEQQAELKRRLDAGPREEDGGCTLHGEDVRRILREEFHVGRSLSATYYLLHRLGYASLVPRPKHRKTDPERQQRFLKKNCPSGSWRFATSGPTSDC